MAWPKVLIFLAALLTSGAAYASGLPPAEQPPPDFTARQYIDSKGCVFLRDGAVWVARQARDGTMLCGYPPTFSARRRGPDQGPALFSAQTGAGSRAQQIEQVLTEALITNLKAGELASDPRPLASLPDMGPEPAQSGPIEELRAEMAAKPAISAKMGGGLRPNQELCNLLGYNGAPDGKTGPAGGKGALGSDPSGGFCADLPRNDLARLAFSRPVPPSLRHSGGEGAGDGQQGDRLGADAAGSVTKTAALAPARPPAKATKGGGRSQGVKEGGTGTAAPAKGQRAGSAAASARSAPVTTGPARSLGDLVPPGARYVHIGAYADPANAQRAIARLTGSGLPILKSSGKGKGEGLHLVMAGPFNSRQAVVMALDKLRKAGFRDAFAR
ncbi:SPOR domain-containing protein [Paracoccus cavernae]|uniref:SPOR domain-containing protein n=1 Tax=Paracoccus cavernae TaxID=1571207 RepID=UPI0035F41345